MRTNPIRATLALFVALAGLTLSVPAQDGPKEAPKEKGTVKEAKKTPPVALVGADVYTVTRGILRKGTVILQDGKIARVGQDIPIPADAVRVDVSGKVLTPGFISVSASGIAVRTLGNPGGGGPPGAGGAGGRFADALNPFDRNILFCLGSGITTACVEVAAGGGGRFGRDGDLDIVLDPEGTQVCPCCGLAILPTEPIGPTPPTERTARRAAVLRLTYGDMTPMLLKESPFYHLPAGAFSGALNRHQWRETIRRTRQQLKDEDARAAAAEGGLDFGGPGAGMRRVPDDLAKLVTKKIPLRTEASSAEQMRDMIALARELDYDLVLDGVHEAWLMANELSTSRVQTILTPRSRRRPALGKEETTGSSIETSQYLEKAGVPFAVAPLSSSVSLDGLPGRDLTSLALEAAFAIRGGCSEQTALAALTITPARMLGLADRIGSIEEGKDADLLILDGPPLDYRSYVEKAYIGGKVYYDRNRERIYPEGPKR